MVTHIPNDWYINNYHVYVEKNKDSLKLKLRKHICKEEIINIWYGRPSLGSGPES